MSHPATDLRYLSFPISVLQGSASRLVREMAPEESSMPGEILVFVPQNSDRLGGEVQRFRLLADSWKAEIGPTSSVHKMALHPAYQEIIAMGNRAVPHILRELEREPDHWFWALRHITGQNPVKPENRGTIAEMANDWIEWGRQRGYLH